MIIWKGYGFLVPIIVIVIFILVELFVNLSANDATYYGESRWAQSLAVVISSLAVGFIGLILNLNSPKGSRFTVIRYFFGQNHDFFFIPFQHWSVIILAIGFYVIFYHL